MTFVKKWAIPQSRSSCRSYRLAQKLDPSRLVGYGGRRGALRVTEQLASELVPTCREQSCGGTLGSAAEPHHQANQGLVICVGFPQDPLGSNLCSNFKLLNF